MRLDGKIALVTGAARGIGKGCALALAREGSHVVLVDRLPLSQIEEECAAEVRALGRDALSLELDVSRRDNNESMIASAVERFDRLDILVANAAASRRGPFLETSEEDLRFTMGVTMFGAFYSCQGAIRQMVHRGQGGSVIVIGSPHGRIPFPEAIAYNMAKAAVSHMAISLAAEFMRQHIRVNLIEPGWTNSPGELQFFTPEELRRAAEKLPFGRLATPGDIGRAVAFLASDDASYITGATLLVDGGITIDRAATP